MFVEPCVTGMFLAQAAKKLDGFRGVLKQAERLRLQTQVQFLFVGIGLFLALIITVVTRALEPLNDLASSAAQ